MSKLKRVKPPLRLYEITIALSAKEISELACDVMMMRGKAHETANSNAPRLIALRKLDAALTEAYQVTLRAK